MRLRRFFRDIKISALNDRGYVQTARYVQEQAHVLPGENFPPLFHSDLTGLTSSISTAVDGYRND
jgi:hypothetical protein